MANEINLGIYAAALVPAQISKYRELAGEFVNAYDENGRENTDFHASPALRQATVEFAHGISHEALGILDNHQEGGFCDADLWLDTIVHSDDWWRLVINAMIRFTRDLTPGGDGEYIALKKIISRNQGPEKEDG